MEKRKIYTQIIVDFFKFTPEVAVTTFCREMKFSGTERLRNALYRDYTLMEDDIYTLMYHLSKFRIKDASGWELHQDPDTPIIIAKKQIRDISVLCVKLDDGEIIRRPITPEMEAVEDYVNDAGEQGFYNSWVDPYADRIKNSWFEYDTSEYRELVTCYEELSL